MRAPTRGVEDSRPRRYSRIDYFPITIDSALAMDLRDLRYFETIATLEHVGRASQELHRTQPALTSCIRRLEQVSGAPLFQKSGRGIRLTPAGRVLLRWAQRLRLDIEDAQREIADIGRGLSGHIRLGIVPTAAEFLLPAAARQLINEAPDVTLKTVVGLIDALKPQLRTGELDLMVATESAADAELRSTLLAEDSIVVAASAKHEIFRSRPTLRSLTEHRWVLQQAGAPTREWLEHAFERRGLPPPRVQVESTSLLMLPGLIEETGLLSFISRHHLSGRHSGGSLREVPIREVTMRRRLVVVHRVNNYLAPAAQRLIDLLRIAGRGSIAPSSSRSRSVR